MGPKQKSWCGWLAIVLVGACSTKREFADEASGGAPDQAGDVAGTSGGGAGTAGTTGGGGSGAAAGSGAAGGPAPTMDCTEGEYHDGTSCTALTDCGAGSWVSSAPTTTSDRGCSACTTGTFSRNLNATACAAWSPCSEGTSESVPPSPTSDRVCSSCGAGKFEQNGECQALTPCLETQYESTAPTATSDRACADVTSCDPGSKQTSAPTSTTDRQCAPCSSGTFSMGVNATICAPWTVCGANQKQSKAGTPTTDVVCVDKPVCSTAADRACSADCPCASGEGVCTKDEQCESGAKCVEGSGIKVGRSGNTCLATHCDNDTKDSTETSVDCGGECGCRATFEVVPLKGLAADTNWTSYRAISRDGKRLVGEVGRMRSAYAAVIAPDGTVTELPAYGKSGAVYASSADGNILVGGVSCTDPPGCTGTTWSVAKWTGSAAPSVLIADANARAVSSSGSIIAGDIYDAALGRRTGFIYNGSSRTSIPDLTSVAGMTPDGKHVAGGLQSGVQGGLWEAQTKAITKVGLTTWTSTYLLAVNGTTPAVVGYGYISASDSYIGFRWKSGTLTQLGLLSGGKYTHPAAVSADGSTVVGLTGTNDFQQAFIWTDQNKLRALVDELAARGLELPVDLRLTSALLLSDDGKTIVGSASGQPAAFWRATLQ